MKKIKIGVQDVVYFGESQLIKTIHTECQEQKYTRQLQEE